MEFRETFNLYYLDRHDVHMELSLNSRSAGAQFDSYSDASSQDEVGGYALDFGPHPPDEYICPICFLVVRGAYQSECCGKIICQSCLWRLCKESESQNVRVKCPNCRHVRPRWFKDQRANYGIHSLTVRCSNSSNGCAWNGELRDFHAHICTCSYKGIHCPYGCGAVVQRKNKEQHLKQCPNRLFKCEHCNEEGVHILITTTHKLRCPKLPVPCLNADCNEMVPRSRLAEHLSVCPKYIIQCPLSLVGCKMVFKREEIAHHYDTFANTHMKQVVDSLMSHEEKMATLEMKVEALEKGQKEGLQNRRTLEARCGAKSSFTIKMTEFSVQRRKKKTWHSPGFYVAPAGYLMCLSVDAHGYKGMPSHVACGLCLLRGENDEILQWPLRGMFSIELLNQSENKHHWKEIVTYSNMSMESWNSPVPCDQEHSRGWGKRDFIAIDHVLKNSCSKQCYLVDDMLFFRVTVLKLESKSKPWLLLSGGAKSFQKC